MRLRPLLALAGLATLLLANTGSESLEPSTRAAFERGNCNLCHTVPGIQDAPREASCRECHLWIRATAADPARRAKAVQYFPHWERYERNVASYLTVPSLDAAMARLDPEWVGRWLADPHDVRPGLDEGMPAFALTDAEIGAITARFAQRQAQVPKTAKPSKKNVELGRARFLTSGCGACHGFGGNVPAAPGIPAAPDLAHTRERMSPDHVVAWIVDPRSVSPSATMPRFGISQEDAVLIRDFLFLGDLAWTEAPPVTAAPTPVQRPVAWAEVEEKVFGKICAHCHMDPALPQNQGRRGPGNAGGFGYAETGVKLQSPEDVCAVKDALSTALLRRREEARRDHVSPGTRPASLTRHQKPGMPLGLPPLPDEDISLVLAYVAQGCPE